MSQVQRKIIFGNVKIPEDINQSAHYESRKWSEISREYCIKSFEVMQSHEFPSDLLNINLNIGGIAYKSHLEHEISSDYKKRLETIRKAVNEGQYTEYKDTDELAKKLGL